MAIDSGYWETNNSDDMNTDDIALLLVKLYADYQCHYGENDDYAKAVAVSVRMLTD